MLPSVAHQSHFLPHHHVDHQPPFDPLNPPYDLGGPALRYRLPDRTAHSRSHYPRPIQRPGAQDLVTTGTHRTTSTSEHTLRRKTPNGTLAAGYDGTPSDRSVQPPATKHILVSSLDNGQALSRQSPLSSDTWQYSNIASLPSSQLQVFPPTYKYDASLASGNINASQTPNNGGWIRSLNYGPNIDSVLNQTTPFPPSQRYYLHNGGTIPTVMPSSLQSAFGPTASAGVGPYGPYWPDGAYIPYRPAAYRHSQFQSPSNFGFSGVQDDSSMFGGVQPQPLPSDGLGAGLSWNSFSTPGHNIHQMHHDTLSQRNFPSHQTLQKPLDGFQENNIPYHSRQLPSERNDLSHRQSAQLPPPTPIDPLGWHGQQPNSIPLSTEDVARPRNPEFKEKILSWAHSVYVDLLASLHHARRKSASLGVQTGQARSVSKPNIYPKPPRQPASDFTSQHHKSTMTPNQHPQSFNHLSQRNHSIPMDGPSHLDANGYLQPVGTGTYFGLGRHQLHGFGQHANHRPADGQAFDGFRTIRRSCALPSSSMFQTPQTHANVVENAVSALEILSSLCLESGWDWIDGMLVGGCLAYGLGDYDKAMRWYTHILAKDSGHVEAISNLAATLLALDRREEAMQHWLRAVKLRPSYFEAVEHLIGLLCSNQRGKEAVGIIEFVETSLRIAPSGECFKSGNETDSELDSRASSVSTTESIDKVAFDYDADPQSPSAFNLRAADNSRHGFGSSGYAIPASDNGRMLALVHAKGNMLYALGDNAGAAAAFEDAILIAAGRRRHGVRSLIRRILSVFNDDNGIQSATNSGDDTTPVLLFPDTALQAAKLVFQPQGNLPGFQHIPEGMAKRAAISTTSNSLLSLAKIYQDGMSSSTTSGSSKPTTVVRDILALYYLSLSLQPSPSTANNVGILMASIQQNGPPRVIRSAGENQLPDIPGVVPGSGIALALAYYNYGLNLDSKHAHLYTNLGSLLKDIGQLPAAIKMYEQAVACDNKFDIALANLANAVKDSGRINEAITYYKRAVAANPDFAEAVCGLANALNSVCDWTSRGGIAAANGIRDRWHVDDRRMLRDAKEMGVDSGWIKRVVEIVDKQLKDGEVWGRGVLATYPLEQLCLNLTGAKSVSPFFPKGPALKSMVQAWSGQKWEGSRIVRLVERVIRYLGWLWYQDRYVHGKEYPLSRYARPQLPSGLTPPNSPTVLPFHTFTTPLSAKQIRHISQRNALRISSSTLRSPWLPPTVYRPPPPPKPHLNVGYVSSDFNNHPLAHLMQSVFGFHNPARVKAFCYATTASDNSSHRKHIEREAPVFMDVSSWSVERLVEQIVKDDIHILVNLNGYTRGARNEVFAARPAPIHMSFMGFAGTLGAEWCDYILSDQLSIPPDTLSPRRRNATLEDRLLEDNHGEDLDDWVYDERIVFTRHSFFCCDHRQSAPDSQEKHVSWDEEQRRRWKMRKEMFPNLPDDMIIFGNFNQLYKIEPTTFRTWLRILARVPKAILWLLRFPDIGEQNLKQTALDWAGKSIADRIYFTDVASKHAHISRARICDLFLDTPECNAHTTAADVLWSGTPLLTLPRYKYKMCSRMASSILTSALPQNEAGRRAASELITASDEEYENRATMLGLDIKYEPGSQGKARGRLVELRKMLFLNRWESKLFDTRRWVSDLEDAYEAVWNKWVRGEEGDVWL